MAKASAGLLMFRRRGGDVEVLLVHPGGPFWGNRDARAWSIPKGEVVATEDPMAAAKREFVEETGIRPDGRLYPWRHDDTPAARLCMSGRSKATAIPAPFEAIRSR